MSFENLHELMNTVTEDEMKKLFTEYVMMMIAKAEKYDRIQELPWVKEGCPDVKNRKEILRQIGEILNE